MASTSSSPAAVPEAFGPLLADVLRLLRADFLRRTREQALTPQLHRLLLAAHRNPGCRQVELAEWLEISPVTVGRMLDRLQKQGLLRREQHPTDRRATRVHLEPQAWPIVRRLAEISAQTQDRALAGLDAAERDALVAGLRRVHENLTQSQRNVAGGRRHGR